MASSGTSHSHKSRPDMTGSVPVPVVHDNDDILVAVLSVTGVGKSRFISEVTGNRNVVVGHSLRSGNQKSITWTNAMVLETAEIRPFRTCFRGLSLTLVDTPGFDDTYRSDAEVFKELAEWLGRMYKENTRLTGLIYMQRITDTRVSGSIHRSLRLFQKLVGESAFSNVILVTSFWDRLGAAQGESRESAMIADEYFWKPMIRRGARCGRFYGTKESAYAIMGMIDPGHGATLMMQKELIDLRQTLTQTTAGRLFLRELEALQNQHEAKIKELREEMRMALQERDEELVSILSDTEKRMTAIKEQYHRDARIVGDYGSWSFANLRLGDNLSTDKTTETSFMYSRLKDEEIRLLELRAGEGVMPIEVSFTTVTSPGVAAYDALSYVWGAADTSAQINVRVGKYIVKRAISQVLMAALQQLRYCDRDRLLWVDALSLNQGDLDERGRETQRMDQIFGSARTVCIWLGPEGHRSDAAMDLASKISDFSFEEVPQHTSSNNEDWLALTALMGRPWFSRRWCVQEVALAKKPIVYCGAKTLSWSDFADAATFFGSKWNKIVRHLPLREAHKFGETQFPGAASLVEVSSHLFRVDQDGERSEPLYTIETLLSMLAIFDVTNSLDAFYALKSLASDTYKNEDITVDYTLQPTDLFPKVVDIVVKTSSSLDIICRPWAPVTNTDLPTWISAIDKFPFVRRNDGQYDRQNGDSLVGPPGKRTYNACGNSTDITRAEIRTTSLTLHVEGFIIGKIDTASDRCVNGNIPAHWMELGDWANRTGTVPPSFWQTLVADRGASGGRTPNWFGKACERLFSRSRTPTPDISLTKLLAICDDSTNRLQQFLERCLAMTWNRSFFLMKRFGEAAGSRNLSGLGPASIMKDDLVCVLLGCSVPVVLRPRSDDFQLLGETFVHDMMDGEAIRDLEAGKFVKQDFTIR